MSSDNDSFSEIGFSDLETVCGQSDNLRQDSEAGDSRVVVQLPPHFSTESSRGSKKAASIAKESVLSEESSFVPVRKFGKMAVQSVSEKDDAEKKESLVSAKQQEDETQSSCAGDEKRVTSKCSDENSETSSWSDIRISKNKANDESSIAASSTISGFDLISLNGSSQKKCHKCSFLNSSSDTFCNGCRLALVANPCLTLDEELSKKLQDEEEKQALNALLHKEKKRKCLHQQTILFRSQTLANDIHSVLESYRAFEDEDKGFCALPNASLTILASRFIECVDEMRQGEDHCLPVKLCYIFTEKVGWRWTQIKQDGFGPHSHFGSTLEAAALVYKRFRTFSSHLDIIPEQNSLGSGRDSSRIVPSVNVVPPEPHGWIAAIVDDPSFERSTIRGASGIAETYCRPKSVQSLPLVSFNATLIYQDSVRRLMNGFTRTCNDFFGFYADPAVGISDVDSATADSKRRKVESNKSGCSPDGDEALALALQAAIYQDAVEDQDGVEDQDDEDKDAEKDDLNFDFDFGLSEGAALSVPAETQQNELGGVAYSSAATESKEKIPTESEESETATDLDGLARVEPMADNNRARNLAAASAAIDWSCHGPVTNSCPSRRNSF